VGRGVVTARDVAAGLAWPPATVGVYAFRDAAGDLLYIGSSRDLARRVRSYFAPRHAPRTKIGRLVRLAARVEWQTCPSVLEALVFEARAIARRRPHFNRRLKQAGRYVWVRIDPRDPYPRLDITRTLEGGPWRHLGPFPGGSRLRDAVARLADALALRTCAGTLRPDPAGRACLRLDLGHCAAPCLARVGPGAYGGQVSRALAALGDTTVDGARWSGTPALPAVLPGPVASALRALGAARRAARVLVVAPAADGPGHRLVAIGGGRLRAAVSAPCAAELAAGFARAVAAVERPLPALVPREALDEIRIVTAWLAGRDGRRAAVDVGRLGRRAAWEAVLARAAPGPLFSSIDRRAPA
jgi:DNA polymerase III subunit epsilon